MFTQEQRRIVDEFLETPTGRIAGILIKEAGHVPTASVLAGLLRGLMAALAHDRPRAAVEALQVRYTLRVQQDYLQRLQRMAPPLPVEDDPEQLLPVNVRFGPVPEANRYLPSPFLRKAAERYPEADWLLLLGPEDRAWYREHVGLDYLKARFPTVSDDVWRKCLR